MGVAGRGSSAFTGAVDISLLLRRSSQGDLATRRELLAVGRFDDTPSLLVLELRDGLYVPLGSAADAVKLDARDRTLEALPDSEGDAIDEAALKKLLDGSERSTGTIGSALRELVDEGVVKRIGEGKKGNAFRYYRPGNSFSQPYIKTWENELSNLQNGGHLVKAAQDMGARIVDVRDEDDEPYGQS